MNKWFGAALVVITAVSMGVAVRAQMQLREERAALSADLSGNPPMVSSITPLPAIATARIIDDEADDLPTMQSHVAALQVECNKLKAELAAARSAAGARTNAASSAKNSGATRK